MKHVAGEICKPLIFMRNVLEQLESLANASGELIITRHGQAIYYFPGSGCDQQPYYEFAWPGRNKDEQRCVKQAIYSGKVRLSSPD